MDPRSPLTSNNARASESFGGLLGLIGPVSLYALNLNLALQVEARRGIFHDEGWQFPAQRLLAKNSALRVQGSRSRVRF